MSFPWGQNTFHGQSKFSRVPSSSGVAKIHFEPCGHTGSLHHMPSFNSSLNGNNRFSFSFNQITVLRKQFCHVCVSWISHTRGWRCHVHTYTHTHCRKTDTAHQSLLSSNYPFFREERNDFLWVFCSWLHHAGRSESWVFVSTAVKMLQSSHSAGLEPIRFHQRFPRIKSINVDCVFIYGLCV